MRTASLLKLVCAAAMLAACATDTTAPTLKTQTSAVTSVTGRYIATVNGDADAFQANVAALGGTVMFMHAPTGIAVVEGLSDAAAASLAKASGVQSVKQDVEFNVVPAATTKSDVIVDDVIASQTNPATAARYSFQWNMRLINAPDAWAAGKLGSSSVTAAILDTGIDYDAPDLNGLVDLSRSASFVASDNAITSTYFPTRNAISDYNGHGTNVATQISSKAVALAGVTSRTTLIGVKVLNAAGNGSSSSILSGILWAADHGANVANMSLGGEFAKNVLPGFVSEMNRVFNYANQKGMLIVVAAGNETEDLDHNGNAFKTYCDAPQVICVSSVGPALATSSPDAPAYYTNFGRSAIAVAGPGGNADAAHNFTASPWPWGLDIASWVWSYCSKTRIAGFTTSGAPVLTVCTAGNRLTGYIGTSQATPHVAGLAALLAANGVTTPAAIKAAISNSADDLGQPGNDPYYGAGRINVAKALGL